MEKLNMTSSDGMQENIRKIQALFPSCVTEVLREGKTTLAVDFDKLKQEMSDTLIDDREERYQFTWPDKKKSIILANSPISATLRPCKEESVDFDNTGNLYIEGDNLDVLKLLQETYLGKIKMIYIDPPYNTGHDFVYNDNFTQSAKEYSENSGQYDEQGNRLFENTESNGRFHTDWLNMIYPRLKIARDLLSEDGVIFISIDDNEIANLKKMCDEILGNSNFINNFLYLHGKGKKDNWSRTTEQYIIAYAKNKMKLPSWTDTQLAKGTFSNPDNDYRGDWFSGSVSFSEERSNKNHRNYFTIESPSGIKWTRQWQCTKEEMDQYLSDNKIYFGASPSFSNTPRRKIFPTDLNEIIPSNLLSEFDSTRAAQKYTDNLFDVDNIFSNPKPVNLIQHLLKISSNDNCIILDFFSGSATTAEAVMQLNAEDGGCRKFIMIQIPEVTDEKSDAHKAGYKNICEIGKERIRRCGKKIKEESPLSTMDLDIGFRVLKLDSSNMKDIYYKPTEYNQAELDGYVNNIKEDRMSFDLLFQVMLELGEPLSVKIEEKPIADKNVFVVNENDIVACFEKDVTEEIVTEIAKIKPLYAIFRDNSFKDDSVRVNYDQIFKTYSPDTKCKVL